MMTTCNPESRQFVFSQNLFIEASAGTGKSYTLQTLLLRLIIEQEMKIEQILIVTFTRLATLELKGRIRRALKNTLHQVRTQESAPEYLQPYLENEMQKKRVERLIRGALASLDHAKIMTIHGFSAYLINHYGEHAGHADEESIASTEQLIHLMKDFFRTELPIEEVPLWQQELLLEHYKGDFDSLVLRIGQLAVKRIPIYAGLDIHEAIRELEEIRASIKEVDLVEKLSSEAINYKGLHTKDKKLKQEALIEFERIAAWVRGEEKELRFKELFKLLPENKLQKVQHVQPLYTRLFEILQKMNDPLVIFAAIAERARLYLSAVLEKESLLFYDDLLLQASLLVERPEIQREIREEFCALFIDEFQDTDSLQWKIFSTLFLEKGLLVVVGDPKQSIYRFRLADLYTYMKAKESFTCQLSLSTNYRSAPRLVEALNELCTPIKDFLLLPERGESFSCPRVEAKKTTVEEKGYCELWSVESEEQLFLWVAQELSALQKRGIKLSECAILVKDRHQMERLKTAFTKISLPLQTARESAITHSAAYPMLLDLLAALLTPSDLSKNAKTLLSPLFALSLEEIEVKQLALLPLFFTWSQLLHEKGLLVAMKAIMTHCATRLVKEDGGFRLYSDFMQLVEVGESLCTSREWVAFFRKLPQRLEGDERLKPRRLLEKEAPLAMTIHMSKGLEFEVIFPIGLIAPFTVRRELVYSSQLNGFHIGEGDAELEAEKMRLFYVAITRAKSSLYLPYIEAELEKIDSKSSASALFMSKRLCEPIQTIPIRTFQEQEIGPFADKGVPQWIEKTLPVPVMAKETIGSFSALFPHTMREKKVGGLAFPLGAEVGTILHALLEKISFRHESEATLLTTIAPLLRGTVLEEFSHTIATLFFQMMHLSLPGGFTLFDLDERLIRKEVTFTTIKTEGSLKGVIDLFFAHQGRYYFLDWKSNYLESFTDEAIEEEMRAEHYLEQAAIYKRALREYIALFDQRPFEELFGGYYYLFMRGPKVYYGR